VYHMIYGNSCEEHKYLAGIRREKESFERLIKEKGSMVLPLFDDPSSGADPVTRLISTRVAGGRKEISKQPSQVIVDMREFRSTLPSLLHASRLLVIPATLTVGDYILTPDICVERKSLTDLVQSFNSGRLFTQCELMSVHYKHPVLLIEFEEDKAFSLDIVSDLKNHAKPTGKFSKSKKTAGPEAESATTSLQSKLVLLTLTFPRLRIIWSSSPYASAEIFNDLKINHPEPDVHRAITIGAEEDPEAGTGVNAAAEELLRCLPGVTAKNVKYVMSKIRNVRHLCEMEKSEVQEILGVEPGKACFDFMHQGEASKKS
jgi:DNA excision repair protein ERCC-4